MDERKYTVYMHTNKINNKSYVGITCWEPEKRWGKNGANYWHNKYFLNAIKKYGWDNFYHDILFTNLSKERACELEQLLISVFMTQDQEFGYNIGAGGEHGSYGSRRTEESKRRLSDSKTGNKNPMYGLNGQKHHRSMPVCQCDMNGCVVNFFWNCHEAERLTGISAKNINAFCSVYATQSVYKIKTAGGYSWRYATSDEIEQHQEVIAC